MGRNADAKTFCGGRHDPFDSDLSALHQPADVALLPFYAKL